MSDVWDRLDVCEQRVRTARSELAAAEGELRDVQREVEAAHPDTAGGR